MKESLKDKILSYIHSQYPDVVHKGTIGRLAVLEWGYENENCGRRCRELENAGIIEKVQHPKGEAQYRWVEKFELPQDFIRLPKPRLTKKQKEIAVKMINQSVAETVKRFEGIPIYKDKKVEAVAGGLFNK